MELSARTLGPQAQSEDTSTEGGAMFLSNARYPASDISPLSSMLARAPVYPRITLAAIRDLSAGDRLARRARKSGPQNVTRPYAIMVSARAPSVASGTFLLTSAGTPFFSPRRMPRLLAPSAGGRIHLVGRRPFLSPPGSRFSGVPSWFKPCWPLDDASEEPAPSAPLPAMPAESTNVVIPQPGKTDIRLTSSSMVRKFSCVVPTLALALLPSRARPVADDPKTASPALGVQFVTLSRGPPAALGHSLAHDGTAPADFACLTSSFGLSSPSTRFVRLHVGSSVITGGDP